MVALSHTTRFEAYQRRLFAVDTLDRETEAELAHRWRSGDRQAGARLIESNLKGVLQIARDYRRWGVPIEDLVQQGSLGLLKAAERFDPDRDSCLRTYASYWIRAEIREYVMRSYRMVRLGTTRTERRAIRAYRSRPVDTVRELVALSGMPEARCELLLPLLRGQDRSLDADQDDRAPTQDRLPSPVPDPEALVTARREHADAARRVRHALSRLNARERSIVEARLLSDEPRTLEQLGQQLGVSRERVRQLESQAKQKMLAALVA